MLKFDIVDGTLHIVCDAQGAGLLSGALGRLQHEGSGHIHMRGDNANADDKALRDVLITYQEISQA